MFAMSQILRVIKPEMIQASCKFYGGHRNLHSHYETLRLPQDATQKDIRLAFLKLSKEMHPDLNKNKNHKDFIKVTEAYQILSKPHTKKQHDEELRYSKGAAGRRVRVVYYDPNSTGRHFYQASGRPDPNVDDYYGVKGIKRVSNLTIALICIVVSAVGLAAQVTFINNSIVFQRDMLLARSAQYQESYRKVRKEADSKSNEEQIAALEQRMKMTDADTGVKLQS